MIGEYYNIDCMELMAKYPDKHFDLAIVDPPYGLGSKLTNGGTWNKKWQDKGSEWDVIPKKDYFDELFRVSKNWIIFGANYFVEFLPNCRNFISWHKPYMDGMHSMSNVEIALTSFNKNAKHISINKDSRDRIHVTQKPVKLYEWVLQNYAEKENLILDTHVGSASSLIACENMKYKYVGCELDKDYYNKSLERLKFHIKSNNYDFVF
jgi:site-specific DNA-methyltransferase (adenine-specific)